MTILRNPGTAHFTLNDYHDLDQFDMKHKRAKVDNLKKLIQRFVLKFRYFGFPKNVYNLTGLPKSAKTPCCVSTYSLQASLHLQLCWISCGQLEG